MRTYGFLVASYRRRMGLVVVREMARHRYRQSQLAGLTRHHLDEIAREREAQRQGAARATERADRSIEIALSHVPSAFERARGG